EPAIAVVKQMSEYLGKGLAIIASVVNPQAFIIGGGVSKAGQYLIDNVENYYRDNCFGPCSNAEVKLAELGNDAGIIGAAALITRMGE
nr:ROK family protein [Eubacterium sp.]